METHIYDNITFTAFHKHIWSNYVQCLILLIVSVDKYVLCNHIICGFFFWFFFLAWYNIIIFLISAIEDLLLTLLKVNIITYFVLKKGWKLILKDIICNWQDTIILGLAILILLTGVCWLQSTASFVHTSYPYIVKKNIYWWSIIPVFHPHRTPPLLTGTQYIHTDTNG